MRRFRTTHAVRDAVPLLLGVTGASGSGKTYSALRLATGLQRVSGGQIHVIDTEAGRAKMYADDFRFEHTEFVAPFGPLDYLAAIEHCVALEAGVIVIDSFSHVHEGEGGILDMADAAEKRMARPNKMAAFREPKLQHRRLVSRMLQLRVHFIFCLRAQEKTAMPEKGQKDPVPLGWVPICESRFAYELTANALLLPRSDGVPTWQVERKGEQLMVKLPRFFEPFCGPGVQMSEEMGEQMARWATAGKPAATEAQLAAALAAINGATTKAELDHAGRQHRDLNWSPAQRETMRGTFIARREAL